VTGKTRSTTADSRDDDEECRRRRASVAEFIGRVQLCSATPIVLFSVALVCVCVSLSVCLFVDMITPEPFEIS